MRKADKGYIVAWIIAILSVTALVGTIAYKYLTKVVPLFTEADAELGSKYISTEITDYIEAKDFMLNKAVLDISDVNLNKVGDYVITCTVRNDVYEYTVHVKDTTAPSIEFLQDQIYGTYNRYELDKFAEATDLSKITKFEIKSCETSDFKTVKTSGSEVYLEDAGDYKLEFLAQDEYGNVARRILPVHFQEAPHFEFLADRKIKIGDDFNVMDFVYAKDQYGNDLSEKITCDANGFSTEKAGNYKVSYSVTDADGIGVTNQIFINVDEYASNDYGFDFGANIGTLKKYGYFTYKPLAQENTDMVSELTKKTSLGIKSEKTIGSAYVYRIDENNCYFVTAKHCAGILTKDAQLHIVNWCGMDQKIPKEDIKSVKHDKSDVMMFSIPTSKFSPEFLEELEEVFVDWDIYNSLAPNANVVLNTQEHGFLGEKYKDIIKVGQLKDSNIATMEGYKLGDDFFGTTSISQPGCSGCPIFDGKGNLVATVQGRWSLRKDGTSVVLGLNTRIDRLPELYKNIQEK